MTRPAAQWVLSTQETSLLAGAVVNAASFTPDIAPGGLIDRRDRGHQHRAGDAEDVAQRISFKRPPVFTPSASTATVFTAVPIG